MHLRPNMQSQKDYAKESSNETRVLARVAYSWRMKMANLLVPGN